VAAAALVLVLVVGVPSEMVQVTFGILAGQLGILMLLRLLAEYVAIFVIPIVGVPEHD